MNANKNNIQHYADMQKFTDFIIANHAFVKENASIEVINGIDKQIARQHGMSSTPFAGNLAVKFKRYGFNVIKANNADVTGAKSYLLINNIGDYSATIGAIQTFVPITEILYNTGNVMQ